MRTKKVESVTEQMADNLRSAADKLEDEVKALRRAADMLCKVPKDEHVNSDRLKMIEERQLNQIAVHNATIMNQG